MTIKAEVILLLESSLLLAAQGTASYEIARMGLYSIFLAKSIRELKDYLYLCFIVVNLKGA